MLKDNQIEVGIALWRDIRDAVKEAKFYGKDIDYIESSGWFSRVFTFKGRDAQEFMRIIANWAYENDLVW